MMDCIESLTSLVRSRIQATTPSYRPGLDFRWLHFDQPIDEAFSKYGRNFQAYGGEVVGRGDYIGCYTVRQRFYVDLAYLMDPGAQEAMLDVMTMAASDSAVVVSTLLDQGGYSPIGVLNFEYLAQSLLAQSDSVENLYSLSLTFEALHTVDY